MNAFRRILVWLFSISLILSLVLMSTVNGEPIISLQSILPGISEKVVGNLGMIISGFLLLITALGFKTYIQETVLDLVTEGVATVVMYACFSAGNYFLGTEYLGWTILGSVVIGMLTALIVGRSMSNRF